jgi:hypothetical protein
MKISLFAILMAFAFSNSWAQQNLIPNGSFETTRTEIWNKIIDGTHCNTSCSERIILSHLGLGGDKEPGSLVKGWYQWYGTGGGGGHESFSVIYLMAPDLFTAVDGNQYVDASIYGSDNLRMNSGSNTLRLLSGTTSTANVPGLTVETNPINGLLGLDCSVPDTKFGQDVFASDGDNYLALFDFTRGSISGAPGSEYGSGKKSSKPFLFAKLESSLVEGKMYRFVMTRAQMNLLDQIKSSEGWGSVEDAKIEVHLGRNINGSGEIIGNKQKIFDEDFSHTNWETDSWTFKADKNWEYIRITVNPVGHSGNRIGGVFIDNLKLYEDCETALNQCNNQNYRCDMLDVNLEKTNKGDPLAYPDPQQGNKDHLETIKATNLENVKHLTMQIKLDDIVIRTIDLDYPPAVVVWDGRHQNGSLMPEDNYEAVIHTISNNCYSLFEHKTKSFHLRRKYTTFNNIQITTVPVQTVSGPGVLVPAITGLDNVHWMNMKVLDAGYALVHEANFNNPPSEMLLSTYFGNTNGVPEFSTGEYHIYLYVSNNCQSTLLGNDWDHFAYGAAIIGNFTSYDVVDPSVFDWVFTPKPDAECPFEHNYQDNYLSPRNCCEGNLYIQDVDIHNDFVVNIQNNIYFGPNVTFGNNGYNTFLAGDAINVDPGMYIPPGADVYLIPDVYNCITCIQVQNGSPTNSTEALSFIDLNEEANQMARDESSGVYPNPSQSGDIVNVRLLKKSSTGESSVLLYDGLGKEYSPKVLEEAGNKLRIRLPNDLSSGMYYLKVDAGDMIQSFRIQVLN